MGLVNGVENYAEYSAYHKNTVNIWIHILCVPMIVFSLILAGLAFPLNNALLAPYIPSLKDTLLPHPICLGLLLFLVLYSFLLEPFLGLLFDLEVLGFYVLGKYIVNTYGYTEALYIAIGVHVVSWVIQFVGHGAFEKVLFMFGYRPDFHKSIQVSSKKFLPKKN